MTLLVLSDCVIQVATDNDANSGGNDTNTALLITAGSYTGTLTGTDNSDRFDYYKLSLQIDDVINITMTPLSPEDDFTLSLDPPIGVTRSNSQGPGETENLVHSVDSTGDYFVIVNLPALTTYNGDYSLEITVQIQNEGIIGGDAGNDYGTASVVSYGTYTGTLTYYNDYYDYYQMDLTDGDTILVTMTPDPNLNFNLALDNPSFNNVIYSATGGEGISESFTYQVNVTGTWYIIVQIPAFESYNGNYALSIVSGDTTTTTTRISTSPTTTSSSESSTTGQTTLEYLS